MWWPAKEVRPQNEEGPSERTFDRNSKGSARVVEVVKVVRVESRPEERIAVHSWKMQGQHRFSLRSPPAVPEVSGVRFWKFFAARESGVSA